MEMINGVLERLHVPFNMLLEALAKCESEIKWNRYTF